MIVYSKRIIQFVHEIRWIVKDILSREVRLKVAGDRFYDQRKNFSYPIKVVIYNNKKMLGYFDSDFYEMGFHECLILSSQEQLYHIIRHELAHYITFITFGETIQPHAAEFKSCCQQIGWGEEVYKATFCLDNGRNVEDKEQGNNILRKVQKLMALATSSNKNEAEQAMIKSQQLLLKHHMDSKEINNPSEEKIFLKRIMKQKRENAKMRSIARILETFFVSTVYSRAGDYTYLEILGNAVNVEIAEYVAVVLQDELDKRWSQAQHSAHLKGTIAKNSFFLGLAKGYCNKIQALKRDYPSDAIHAVMVIENKLIDAKAMVYRHLSFTKSNGNYCQKSSVLGEKMGRQLTINPAIHSSTNTLETLLTYSG